MTEVSSMDVTEPCSPGHTTSEFVTSSYVVGNGSAGDISAALIANSGALDASYMSHTKLEPWMGYDTSGNDIIYNEHSHRQTSATAIYPQLTPTPDAPLCCNDTLSYSGPSSLQLHTNEPTCLSVERTYSPGVARSDSGCDVGGGPLGLAPGSNQSASGYFSPAAGSPAAAAATTITGGGMGSSSSGCSPWRLHYQATSALSGYSSPGLSVSRTPSTTSLSRNDSDAGSSQYSIPTSPTPQLQPLQHCQSPSASPSPLRQDRLYHHHHPHYHQHIQQTQPLNLTPACDLAQEDRTAAGVGACLGVQATVNRQQLINSPCPVCGDKISGFHYGIFSCESCKGFFKRTVQNKKNYVCLRGASCPVTIVTRKKCPACRFDKCLNMGMKLEAIREDRTRGGRSTYQCTYTGPSSAPVSGPPTDLTPINLLSSVKQEPPDVGRCVAPSPTDTLRPSTPPLLKQICEVEYLWHRSTSERMPEEGRRGLVGDYHVRKRDAADYHALCNMADHRLYKIVKWCKSLPVFKNIHIDDQTVLLINTWCQLLLLTCCFRSVDTPGRIRISHDRQLTVEEASHIGVGRCVERMLGLTEQLCRLKVDYYEYIALKVIVLLSSSGESSVLKEPQQVATSRELVLQALQQYTMSHYPHMPSKFGELLLRIPDIERACQLGKELMAVQQAASADLSSAPSTADACGGEATFDILFELLRGD